MRLTRRHDDEVRLELTPLIDVVFLLLTFFIFSLVVMVRANLLPVELIGIGSGEPAAGEPLQAVTIDRDGRYFLNQQPIEPDALRARLEELAGQEKPPRLYVGIESTSSIDRGPLLLQLIELARQAGLDDLAFIGPPPEGMKAEGGGRKAEPNNTENSP
ncbi:MAG: biopolymer transporter ExbD [Phycisphaeraceae bacterium]|nr:biopolymer transporter ExbD [Phycisphaeraceae bacterium]